MRVIAFIEDEDVIKKILKHLRLPACASHADRWDIKRKPAPRANGPQLKPLSSMMILILSFRRPIIGSNNRK